MMTWSEIESTLLEWQDDPSQLEDIDIEPPSIDVIQQAIEYTIGKKTQNAARENNIVRVCPDGDGGITIDIHIDDFLLMTDFEKDGTIEEIIIKSSKVVYRNILSEGSAG